MQSEAPAGEDATGQTQRSRRDRGEPVAGVERVAERARRPGGEGAKEQAGTVDPGMGASRGAVVAGEGKADPSCRSRRGEAIAGCGALGDIDPEAGKNRYWGSGTAKHPALPDAVFGTVHARGEPGCESDHLEPFFCGGAASLVRPTRLPPGVFNLLEILTISSIEDPCPVR